MDLNSIADLNFGQIASSFTDSDTICLILLNRLVDSLNIYRDLNIKGFCENLLDMVYKFTLEGENLQSWLKHICYPSYEPYGCNFRRWSCKKL